MKILIIGAGAREHAIAKALLRSPQTVMLFGVGPYIHPGIAALSQDYLVCQLTENQRILQFAQAHQIDFAIVGPEIALANGIVDLFESHHLSIIGPNARLARIETDKAFARDLMQKYRIPGLPGYQVFTAYAALQDYLQTLSPDRYVLKANGLRGGKGVQVGGEHFQTTEQALAFCKTILPEPIVVEEKLIGQEFSMMCFSDGKTLVPMPLVQDHKRAFEGDQGPNTGGMGSYSDHNHALPFLTAAEVTQAFAINQAVCEALQQEMNATYRGILYGSFIATAQGIYAIEFNARFGDPEALNVLSILDSDFVTICQKIISGTLTQQDVQFAHQATVCKYVVPQGYPEQPKMGEAIELIPDVPCLYLASIEKQATHYVTLSSRTAAFVGVSSTLTAAEQIAEQAVSQMKGPLFHRKDIGTAQAIQQKMAMMQQLRNA